MPTENPRVNVTLSPALFHLVSAMARGQRASKSQVLRELLEAAEPALQRVVALMDAAEKAKGAVKAEFGESLQRSQDVIESELARQLESVDGITADLVSMAERIEGRRPARRAPEARGGAGVGAESTPVPVTRGSGTPGRATKAKGREGVQPPKSAGKGVSRGRV
jgi:hypothetical protein